MKIWTFHQVTFINCRYHNDRMINYDTDRGISVTKDGTGSTLTLKKAGTSDSGNYTCSPYNIRAASVLVHVLSEGNSAAAVQNSSSNDDTSSASVSLVSSSSSKSNNQAPPSAAVHSSASKMTGLILHGLQHWPLMASALLLWAS